MTLPTPCDHPPPTPIRDFLFVGLCFQPSTAKKSRMKAAIRAVVTQWLRSGYAVVAGPVASKAAWAAARRASGTRYGEQDT